MVVHDSNPTDPAEIPTVRKNKNSNTGMNPAFFKKN